MQAVSVRWDVLSHFCTIRCFIIDCTVTDVKFTNIVGDIVKGSYIVANSTRSNAYINLATLFHIGINHAYQACM